MTAPDSAWRTTAAVSTAAACLLALFAKLLLVWRINVNWDEFYYLTLVHQYLRDELSGVLQLAHVHLFFWLPAVGPDEMAQIAGARIVMWAGLAATVLLIAKLASYWVSGAAVWFAPLAFLAASPILKHGASFRADSLLAPLSLLVLVLVVPGKTSGWRIGLAAAIFGIAMSLSIKAALLAPLILLMMNWKTESGNDEPDPVRVALTKTTIFLAGALVTMGGLLFLHWLSLPNGSYESLQTVAVDAARTTVLDVPFFPRWSYFEQTLRADWVSWLLILAGFAIALVRSRRAALCALSLAPLLFYRNAFPYYYVVMLAPAAILAAVAVDALLDTAGRRAAVPSWVPPILVLPLAAQAAVNLDELRHDRQQSQRRVIAAVHQIFPDPVRYIDHSGMIASFPKANFFMTSWGIESYRERGVGFVRAAIDAHRPPLLLANSSLLRPASDSAELLLDEDRRLIEKFYVPYWDAISVAGAEVELTSSVPVSADLPFPGRFRVETDTDLLVDGVPVSDGALIEIAEDSDSPSVSVRLAGKGPASVRFVWAGAMPPPPGDELPPTSWLYSGL